MATTTDPNGPGYYKRGSTDVWDFIREQGLNFHLGNAIKYICRAGYKGDKLEDLRKAIHYLQNELEYEENVSIRSGEGIPIQIRDQELTRSTVTITPEGFDR
jgi:hypothetical protein